MEKKVENGVLSIVELEVEKLSFLAELRVEAKRVEERKKELNKLLEKEYSYEDWDTLYSNIDEQITRLENITGMHKPQHNEEEQRDLGTTVWDDDEIKAEVTDSESSLDYNGKVDLIVEMDSDQEKLKLFYDVSASENECKGQNNEGFPEYVHPEFFAIIIASLKDENLKVKALEQLKKYFESKDYKPEAGGEDVRKYQRDISISDVVKTLRNPDIMMKYYREVYVLEARLAILEAISQLPEYKRKLTIEEMQEVNRRIMEKVVSQQVDNDMMRHLIEVATQNGVEGLTALKEQYKELMQAEGQPALGED